MSDELKLNELQLDALKEFGNIASGNAATALSQLIGKSIGMKIFEDCSYQFFEVDDTMQRLERMNVDEDLAIGDQLQGRIIAYFTDKGFGFIQTDDDRKYFFHIANVVDDELRARLPGYVLGEIIAVEFQYGGNDGKKYPKAINVSLSDEDLGDDSDYYEDDFDSDDFD